MTRVVISLLLKDLARPSHLPQRRGRDRSLQPLHSEDKQITVEKVRKAPGLLQKSYPESEYGSTSATNDHDHVYVCLL